MAAARVSRAAAPPDLASLRRATRRLLDATADPDGRGLLLRGEEHQPHSLSGLARDDASMRLAVEGSLRLAALASELAASLREHPEAQVRRAAALLAARAYPLLAADGV